jgi:hypothetical protein
MVPMVDHTLKIALPIFRYTFPGCRGVWAFDNAANHSAFAPDALLASRINLYPGGKQPLMREGFDHPPGRNLPHSMVISQNHNDFRLRGKAKGAEIILRERRLWPLGGRRSDGMKLLLRCPIENGRSGCALYRETELERNGTRGKIVNTLLKGYVEFFPKHWILSHQQPSTVTIKDVCGRWMPIWMGIHTVRRSLRRRCTRVTVKL